MSARPRILYGYQFGVLGGVSVQLLNRYPVFSQDFDMRVLFETDHGMVARFPAGVAREVATHDQRVAAITEAAPDVMVVIDSPAFVDAWHDAGRPGRLVLEVHTTYRNMEVLDHVAHDEVAAVVTVSRYMVEVLRERGFDRVAPIHIVPNCLDSRWRPTGQPTVLPERPILWVGKLDSHKRWRTALEIMDETITRLGGRPWVPLFVGGYTAQEPAVEELLGRLYGSAGLRGGHWWPTIPYERMPHLYESVGAAGGCMLVTSKNESFGMAVAEGTVMGCPVVAPAVGALPELLPAEALYDPERSGEAVATLERIASDASLRDRLLAETQAKVRALVDPERSREAYAQVIAAARDGSSG